MSCLIFPQFIVDTWWETYGTQVSHLQKLVVQVLSQTYISSGCERNQSVFEKIHTKKRNRFENLKLNSKFIISCNLCPMGNLCILNSNWINLWSSYRLDTQCLNDVLYASYNIRLWVKQLEKKPEMEAISSDVIVTTAAQRMEIEEPIMEAAPDWLEDDTHDMESEM